MKIQIIQVGKTKEKLYKIMESEFLKRLGPFSTVTITEIKPVTPSKTFTKARCVEEEGERILGSDLRGFVVALDETGREKSSAEFAEFLKGFEDRGEAVIFVIGGPYGLSKEVKERADLTLSLSRMTFTHQMVRLFLLEQIYRGICIIHGKEYHN